MWLSVDYNGKENVSRNKPFRGQFSWWSFVADFENEIEYCEIENLFPGTIQKLIGRCLSWKDEPVWYE